MRLFRIGDRMINFDAIAHLQFSDEGNGAYCQIFFDGTAPKLLLKGDQALAFWAITRHLSIDITPVKPEPKPELVETAS
ncbi:hypothetical protein IQ250_12480 [Pseudanabaenaceae cyanobacterium LEGE 13415]|nr:hypothetical protein [Pseudanabaenaceae cyanobacterium LEGE 13415]